MEVTSPKGTVYLAGPITGLSYGDARYGWREHYAGLSAPGIRLLSPMRHEGHLSETLGLITGETGAGHIMSKGRTIFTKDMLDIKRSDVVLVNLSGAPMPARGSLVEIGAAWALGKYIVLVVDKGDFHDYPFITEAASVVVYSIDDAAEIINSLLSEGI